MYSFEEKLREASQRKGSPLSDSEKAAVHKEWTEQGRREELSAHFLAVIAGEGYGHPEHIRDKYLDEYMQDVPRFVAMLEEYERKQSGRRGYGD